MKQLTDKQWTRISSDYGAMYVALRRIVAYASPRRLRSYGLDSDECIEYAYENVITEAKNGLRRVKNPFVEKPSSAAMTPPLFVQGERVLVDGQEGVVQYDSAAVRRYIGVKLGDGRVKEYAVENVQRKGER